MKTGFVALVGLPNAGKSTLVNSLIGEKVGIVSRKPQTTRKRVLGIYNDVDSQIVFVDSPGKVQAEAGLNHYLEKELASIIRESDACLAILNVDAKKSSDLFEIVRLVKSSGKPWAALITKTDLDPALGSGMREAKIRTHLLEMGVPVIAGTVLKKPDELKSRILPVVKTMLPDSDAPLYPDEIYTTQAKRELVAEVVREKCFEYLHQEVPYGLAVKVIKYDESDKLPKIYVDIIVTKENFVSMVIGRSGAMIKRISASARIECERIFAEKIYLETHVKVKENWIRNPDMMKELGYVITD